MVSIRGKDLLDEVDEGEQKTARGMAHRKGEQEIERQWADRKDERADCKGEREDGEGTADGEATDRWRRQTDRSQGALQVAKAYEFQMVWPTSFHDEVDQNVQFPLTRDWSNRFS
ncbi:hypothetical protein BS47DRAFT_1400553 [Hydnum rufescens UP504]|uniref:Uncharacterized protein n=1 Tax=Hydnum rufescens UP504 TaxID=1448309 RepID=A0A9P6AH86_9AGAM|nr:hypothetical protein BS47DRAFT_1400553 [Hydnum rufescens UP504]